MKRNTESPSVETNPYSVLKLSVTRLLHVREVQSTGGGHFAQVARELGYTRKQRDQFDDMVEALDERELALAEQLRRKRSDALVERLKRARERLGVGSGSVPPLVAAEPRASTVPSH